MRVLVTGSSGFVGSALTHRLRNAGHIVTGFGRRPAPDSIQGNLLDSPTVNRAIQIFQPEIVYHLAAQTKLKGFSTDGFRVNTDGVEALLEAVRNAGSVRRVVWMSSQLVCKPGRPPAHDTDFDPADDYGASKAEGERLVRAADGGGKTWTIVRSTTIWGPGMSEHYAGVIRLIQRGLYFHVGRQPQRKSYSYIENLAAQLVSVGTAPDAMVHEKVFYLADSEPLDLRTWADAFAQQFGRKLHTIPAPAARALGLAGDLAQMAPSSAPVSSSRIANMLTEYVYDTAPIDRIHGRTAIPWRDGVRRTAAWIKAGEPAVAHARPLPA